MTRDFMSREMYLLKTLLVTALRCGSTPFQAPPEHSDEYTHAELKKLGRAVREDLGKMTPTAIENFEVLLKYIGQEEPFCDKRFVCRE